eukprot:TRINITY_DN2668_c0_g1_i1.p1 TRINITY_DN2668_c0_g1~~TRINITY_DN2668_c0_g1_i1.p1  ORF type:complete len:470 (-),score=102.04 TRINITY_DN2668_c0_g1_i1:612-1985(-)
MGRHHLAGVAAAAAILLAFYQMLLDPLTLESGIADWKFGPHSVAIYNVEGLSVDEQRKILEEAFFKRKPTIVRNLKTITEWPALKKWNPQYLKEQISSMENVLLDNVHNETYYYYDKRRPMSSKTSLVKFIQPYNPTTITSEDFFRRLEAGERIYFSHDLSDVERKLLDDVPSWNTFLPVLKGDDVASANDNVKVNLWVGSPEVTTRMHYDASDNIYIQVHGIKKFTIVDPIEYRHLYLFSFLHPGTRQSQADIYHANLTEFPLIAKVKGQEAVLYPGDLLLLPSYWFHHVQAITASFSVSTYILTEQKRHVQDILKEPVPIDKHFWVEARKECAAQMYIDMIVQKLNLNSRDFVRSLLQLSYSHFHLDPMLKNAQIFELDLSTHKKTFCLDCSKYIQDENLRTQLLLSAENIRKSLARIYEPGVREIAVSYYIEQVASEIVDVKLVHEFFYDCFLS